MIRNAFVIDRPAWAIALLLAIPLASACVSNSEPPRETDDSELPDDGPASDPVIIDTDTGHSIMLASDASPSEEHAAQELRHYIEAVMGIDMPVLREMPDGGGPAIFIGDSEAARELLGTPDPADLGEQESRIVVQAPHVAIVGTPEVGTLYGVHRFIEDELGVRWLAPGVTTTPTATSLTLSGGTRAVEPAFAYRHTSYRWPGKDDDFLARTAYNAGRGKSSDPHGLKYHVPRRAHSYFRFISPDEFFDDHPEYFSEINGERVREATQLCLTNPDVLEIVTERMLAQMANDPEARQHNFSQHDRYNFCTCDRCNEINERYGTNGGTQFWFVNELAERTSAVYPDKLINTLAYMYTEEPPVDMTMHPNVAIWLCHMYPSCQSHPIATCPHNATFARRVREWSELTDHLYIWHYIVNFAHYYTPYPNFGALAADLRFYRDVGVEGIYLQGMGHSGGGGEFSLLRPYYAMKLLWDPDQDPDALMSEFLQGYYGAAAGPIRRYIALLQDRVDEHDLHMHLYTNPGQGYLPDEVVTAAEALFDEAEALVTGDVELLERVRVARMPLVYARFFPRNGYTLDDGYLRWAGDIAGLREIGEFIDRMEAHGFKSVRELESGTETLSLFGLLLQEDWPVYDLYNDHLVIEVAPVLGGRVLRIIDVDTGRSVTAHNTVQNMFFPFAGGLEDRVGEYHMYYGWVEQAQVIDHDSHSITISFTTLNGWHLTRTMRLMPDEPAFEVETSIVNPDDEPREGRLRSHLELALGDLESARIEFTDRTGWRVEEDLREVIANQREGVRWFDERLPDGSWTFYGDGGLAVTQSFDPEQIEHVWTYAYPPDLDVLEVELWMPSAEVHPGEAIVLRQRIEVSPAPVVEAPPPGDPSCQGCASGSGRAAFIPLMLLLVWLAVARHGRLTRPDDSCLRHDFSAVGVRDRSRQSLSHPGLGRHTIHVEEME